MIVGSDDNVGDAVFVGFFQALPGSELSRQLYNRIVTAESKGKSVVFSLGYTHPVDFPIPDGIQVSVDRNTRISVTGISRQQVGQVAADMRAIRPPDVYKLKGVRYENERLRKKAGKTGAA